MTPKENTLRAIFNQNPEWVPKGSEAVWGIPNPVVERPEKEGKDSFGTDWAYDEEAQGGTYPSEKNLRVTDISKWREQVEFPDPQSFDWTETAKQAAGIDRSCFLVQGYVEMGIFERTYLLMGMEQALMAYYTNPEDMFELCSAIADYKIKVIERYYEAGKPDLIWYGDDWGTQNNLFISPDIWRKIIRPNTQRIYDCIKSLGMIINQHSCGKIESVVGDIIEMGAGIWNPCQPCNDLAGLKQRYGNKLCFCGGIDSQFVLANPEAGPEDVIKEVKKRISELALPDGGYLAAPSHSVPYDPEKLAAMENTIRIYGREIYQRKG